MSTELLHQVRCTVRDHQLIQAGDRVLVALSGGGDSTALLHLLLVIAPEFPFFLEAAHLDHGMRPGSREDADFVARLCAGWGVPLNSRRVDVPAAARQRRQGLEEAARDIRRAFLQETAHARGCQVVALGHQRGDQAETILHRLLRGSGGRGLSGMEMRSGPFIRPLLEVPGGQLREYLRALDIPWREDESNSARVFTRNRIRHDLLPRLAEFNPRIVDGLLRLGSQMGREEDYWRQEAGRVLKEMQREAGEGVRLPRAALAGLHPALRARVLRLAISEVRGHLRGLGFEHLELLERFLAGDRPQADLHLPGTWVGRRYDTVWIRQLPPPPPAVFMLTLSGPGEASLPCGGWVRVSLEPAPLGEERWAVEFDPETVSFPLAIRSFRPGDRMRPAGLDGSKKVKEIFMEARIEREFRSAVPIVESGRILWLAGVRRCEGGRPKADGPALRLRFQPAPS